MGAIKPVESIMKSLMTPQMQTQLRAALPKHCTPERMLRVVRTALTTNPKLGECSPLSVIASVVEASQLGLEPNTPLGQCWLIPYKKQCQLQLGFKGLVDLARRSGKVQGLSAEVVHERDHFVAGLGTHNSIEHRKHEGGDYGAFRAAYAVAWFHGGGHQFVVMYKHEIDEIRKTSKTEARDDGPWEKWYGEMAKKTVVKRLCKLLPQSIELARALVNDDNADAGLRQVFDSDVFAAPNVEPDTTPATDVRSRIDTAKRGNQRKDEPKSDPASNPADLPQAEPDELHAEQRIVKDLCGRVKFSDALKVAESVGCKCVSEMTELESVQLLRTAADRLEACLPDHQPDSSPAEPEAAAAGAKD